MPLDLPNIEPVNPRFFDAVTRDPMLSASAKSAIVDRALEGRLSLENVRSKLVTSRQSERLNDLRIEREEFALQEARRLARERQDAAGLASGFRSHVRGILDSPDLTDDEKHAELGRFELDNAEVVSRSPILSRILDTGRRVLPPQLTPAGKLAMEKEERYERQREEDLRARQAKAESDLIEEKMKEDAARVKYLYESVKSAKFKEEETPTGKVTLDQFESPVARHEALAFVAKADPAGYAAAQELTDTALVARVGELYAKMLNTSPALGGLAPENPTVKGLKIPTT